MPNWCYNSLVISGEPEVITKIKEQVSAPYETKHLDWKTNELRTEKVEQPFSYWNIIKPDDLDAYYDNPTTHDQNGRDHWYNWNIRNWGVKWDASDVYESDGDERTLVYTFSSPWGVPHSALFALSHQYPTATLELEYEEETGWGGAITFVNGEAEETEEYDNKCRDCDALNTLEWCETCENELCSECNNTSEADLDTLKECETHKHLAKETVNG
jgi:hypothetical protein